MNNKDRIEELLLKENLSEEEKLVLKQIIESNPESKEFYKFYKKLNDTVKNSSHLSDEEISDYILFKNNLAPENIGIIKTLPKIEDHLRTCQKCSDIFKNLNSEFTNIESFLSSEVKLEKEKDHYAKEATKKRSGILRYGYISIIALAVIYALALGISKISTPGYYDLASIHEEPDFYTTRGRATDDFMKGLNALDNGKLDQAISSFKLDIKNNPEDKTIFYSYYILGLTYLDNAEQDFLGLFPKYNDYYAEQAVENFQSAILKNNSGNYRNITFDAYFYSAKANLILQNIQQAKKDLSIVVKEKGSKIEEAKKILEKLE